MGRRRRLTNVQQGFDEMNELEAYLLKHSLEIVDIEGDGNCLMRALSIHLNVDFQRLRELLVDYIIENKKELEPFTEDNQNIDKYCINMRKDGVYGGNLEIYACAKLYNLIIIVHQLKKPVIVIQDDSPVNIIHLAYVSWEHYSGINVKKNLKCNAEYCNLVGFCASKKAHRIKGVKAIQKATEYFINMSQE